ncbi:MAG: hypothetical protein NVS2B12_18340 [Ktedonobacteraceae bacterium]
MKKYVFNWPILIVMLLFLLMTACGGGLSQQGSNPNPTARAVGRELYILDGYADAGQAPGGRHIVALPIGTAHPVPRLTIPAGLTDLKHSYVYVAAPASGIVGDIRTNISVFDAHSGASVRTFSIPGNYSTSDRGYADSMLSGDGHWLALRDQKTSTSTTSIALVDTLVGKLVKNIHLDGTFMLDAVSPKGTMLYLLEYPQAGTSHYNVRVYNVLDNHLVEGNIVDKTALDEEMEGKALARQMSSNGDMAYTLYLNTVTNKAFIHILWLSDVINNSVPFPTIARCIDLPVGNNSALLRYYTLTLARDGQTLYAANAALGMSATVNLSLGSNAYQLWLIPNAKAAHFDPGHIVATSTDKTRTLYNGAVLSHDKSQLYVAGLHGIWVINTTTLQVQNEYLKQQAFTGLAMSDDGQTLYAVDPATGITLLASASGAKRTVIQGSVQSPWGIAWV